MWQENTHGVVFAMNTLFLKSIAMNYTTLQTPLSKSLMAGLATGIIATIINLIFNFVYRGITKLSLLVSVINVETIIFATMLLCIIAGLIYHFIVFYLKKSDVIYTVVFIVLTVIAVLAGFTYHRSADINVSHQFDWLYSGILIITGLSTAFMIPWLAKHKNFFFN